MPTGATNVRLTPAERQSLEAIRARYGLPSAAAAVRKSMEVTRLVMEAEARHIDDVARLTASVDGREKNSAEGS